MTFSGIAFLGGGLTRQFGLCVADEGISPDGRPQDEVQQKTCGAEKERQNEAGHHEPVRNPEPLGIAHLPTSDEEV